MPCYAVSPVTVSGDYVTVDNVKLDWPPAEVPAIWAGGLGPKTLALCASDADGIVLSGGTTPAQTRAVREIAGDLPIVVYIHGASSFDHLERERVRWGYDSWTDRCATGDADEFAASLRRWADAGATSLIVQPAPEEPDQEGFLDFPRHASKSPARVIRAGRLGC